MSSLLKINNLKVKVENKEILKGIDLEINKGEVHVIMGPNGAGKSTLSNAITGNPKYEIVDGEIIFEGENINDLKVDERAKKGIFMSFQYPEAIPGVTVEEFLRASKSSITGRLQSVIKFKKELEEKMEELHIDKNYANRHLNVGFSGGEKKKNEILQMAILAPKLAILDETDSGLDVDAIRVVYEGVNKLKNENNAILIITHYNKVLNYIKPDFVHVVNNGKIVKSGGIEVAHEIEKQGYENIKVI
ncbi:Fe-S cluster assembly ATP-binding protein [Hypnocyclicus thermotrophus]|uniref:Fe-S cluster assembly ATP-binding protein n=1 Tax=Hypnocyclicus thermotrophus TaxID=1627895 RepID=A0AA46DYF1_9FUSO|nr:Fe-S cluster assembly ATPase SufC [Hypnocyclicus thermotrophus]TDT69879.1 Fe-S cluster assembly ATP-binding protein [Hypnocyclicus thermotrophus]